MSVRQLSPMERHVIAVFLFRNGWEEAEIARFLAASPNRVRKVIRDPRYVDMKNLVPQTPPAVRH